MSNSLYLDESNGNGIFAKKCSNSSNNSSTTMTTTTNNINNMMLATTNAANAALVSTSAVASSTTTNAQLLSSTSASNEDLSQSLSEYTDADESISAPTEFLAEFLSAVMLKDYKKALKYCKLILQYEPNNATAKEFYPLILDKLREMNNSDSDENYNKSSSSPEMLAEIPANEGFGNESDGAASDDQLQIDNDHDNDNDNNDEADDYGIPEDNSSREPNSHTSRSSDSAGISLSDSVDDEVEDDEVDILSSSGDDLPNDDQMRSVSDEMDADADGDEEMVKSNDLDLDNGNKCFKTKRCSRNSSSGGENRSGSDNTTHSFSSLLLEEEDDDIGPVNLQFQKNLSARDLDISNGNKVPSASCSDSESPTEPLTQRLAAILRAKCNISPGD